MSIKRALFQNRTSSGWNGLHVHIYIKVKLEVLKHHPLNSAIGLDWNEKEAQHIEMKGLLTKPSFGKTHRNQGHHCDQCQRHRSWQHTHHRICHLQDGATSSATPLGWCNHTLLSPTQTSQKPFLDPPHRHHHHPSSSAWWNPASPTCYPHRNRGHGSPLQPPHETCAPQWTQNTTLDHRQRFSHLHHHPSDEKLPWGRWPLSSLGLCMLTWGNVEKHLMSVMMSWRILMLGDEGLT